MKIFLSWSALAAVPRIFFFLLGARTRCRRPSPRCGTTSSLHLQGIFFPFFTHLTLVYCDNACRFIWNVCEFLCMVSPPIKQLRDKHASRMYRCCPYQFLIPVATAQMAVRHVTYVWAKESLCEIYSKYSKAWELPMRLRHTVTNLQNLQCPAWFTKPENTSGTRNFISMPFLCFLSER
jgi:hypothetical protein